MNNRTKVIAIQGLGIALFVVMSLCLQVPVFQNYYLCLGYIVMSVYLYFFGVTSGAIVGCFGTLLYCLLINGLRGMPGWVLGNVVVALFMGNAYRIGRSMKNKLMRNVVYIISVVVGCYFGILMVKSLVECLLYSQPIILRVASNVYAFVADIVVLLVSIPLCSALQPVIKKLNLKGNQLS